MCTLRTDAPFVVTPLSASPSPDRSSSSSSSFAPSQSSLNCFPGREIHATSVIQQRQSVSVFCGETKAHII